ncbi:MAG: hypothetical protein EA349_02545 [Halomonadaceae bacterium]|nr:MAG: hypothetical protein EA349_02545 [Halomonadaceae bacterium]
MMCTSFFRRCRPTGPGLRPQTIFLPALLLLLGLSVTSLWADENGDRHIPDRSLYLPLSPAFVVNVSPEDQRHISFLKAEVTLRLNDKDDQATVEEHLPWLRHELVTLFSRQRLTQIQTGEGQDALRQEALEQLNQRLEKAAGEALLRDLLFTTFVLQRR